MHINWETFTTPQDKIHDNFLDF